MGTILENETMDWALAGRLIALRQGGGQTLEEVASVSGISRATLSRIERGETSPTAQVLGRLSACYNVTMSELLLAVEDDTPRLIRHTDAAVWKDPATGFVRTAISPPAKGYAVELVWSKLPGGATINYDAPPIPGMEQHIIVFEGKLRITLADTEYTLDRADCLRMKLHFKITFHNPGRSIAQYLVAVRRIK